MEHEETSGSSEVSALRLALQHAEALVKSKDRELSAQEEIIALLREKIRELEHGSRNGFHFMASPQTSEAGAARRVPSAPKRAPTPDAEEAPKSAWARFYHWLREA